MNWLDIVLICLAGIGFLKGLFDGVIKQVVSLIALAAGIFFCGKAAIWLKDYIVALGWFPEESITIVSYILAFLLIVGILMLAGQIVHRIIGVTPLSIINHAAGGLFGILVVILFSSLLFNVLEVIDRGSVLISRESKIESRLYMPVREVLPNLYPHQLFSLED